jgi:uncharacterized protein DUF4013
VDVQARSAAPSPDSSLGDSFGWPMRDPQWFSKIVLMGLISLIPIVGWLQLVGWMLTSLDHLRRGQQQLPPADFRYASRGVHVFLASLIWGLIVGIVLYGTMGLVVVGMVAMTPKSSSDTTTSAFPLLMFPLMMGWVSLFGLMFCVAVAFAPLVILFTDRAGLGGAFNLAGFVHAIRTSPRETIATGALTLVSYLISGLGTYLCYVGILFTVPYSMAVLAGALRWYEVHAKPGALPPPMTA